MCDNNQQAITMIRGTSAAFGVAVTDEDGNAYTLQSGETLRFGIKTTPNATEYILQKDFTDTDTEGNYTFTIDPADTAALDFGAYWYDIGLQSGEDYWNVIPASAFNIAYNITGLEAE